ncbi:MULTISPECIES: PH domain-containing protein [Streptomyces]|uniref:Membrane protein n=1 Tax=Streptomyces hydrogenans TaxID=1873719 RepID=A0ABQ3P260_9ACTN|nr:MULTISPECIES: PH domain-containing protein [Streptomyces]MCM1944109.1 PH domain-containing protein [Streptomyces sp. G2]GHG34245.1 membrane protein [Streptomyces hydrogenans]GHI19109.1 membrane protein [Streptomyces hydrogenans]
MTSPAPSEPNPEPTFADRVYRSTSGIVGGAFLLALTLLLAGDAMLRGEGRTPWLALAGLLLVVPLVLAFTIRPAVYANEDRLRIRNPFRSILLPWAAVADVRAGYSSEVFTQEGAKYQLWAVPVSLRQRKRAARRAARASQDDPHGRTSVTADVRDSASRVAPSDQNVADLREMAERYQGRPEAQGAPQIRWAYEIIAPAAVGLVLFVVLAATG